MNRAWTKKWTFDRIMIFRGLLIYDSQHNYYFMTYGFCWPSYLDISNLLLSYYIFCLTSTVDIIDMCTFV